MQGSSFTSPIDAVDQGTHPPQATHSSHHLRLSQENCKEMKPYFLWGRDCGRVGLWRRLSAEEWCFWTVVLEKTLESSLDCKEIQPVHSEGDQPGDFFGRTDAKVETPVLWPPHAKSWLTGEDSDAGRDWGQKEKRTTQEEMAGWHHGLDGRESEWLRESVMDREAWRAMIHGVAKSRTWLSDWTELNWRQGEREITQRRGWLSTDPTEHHHCHLGKKSQNTLF